MQLIAFLKGIYVFETNEAVGLLVFGTHNFYVFFQLERIYLFSLRCDCLPPTIYAKKNSIYH